MTPSQHLHNSDAVVAILAGSLDQFTGVDFAGFIGSPNMNFLNGWVFGEWSVVRDGVELPLPAGLGLDAATVGEVRPEHLKIDDGGFPAEVVAIEPMGSSTRIIAKVGETPITIVLSARTALKQALQYVAGSGTQHI